MLGGVVRILKNNDDQKLELESISLGENDHLPHGYLDRGHG